MSNYFTINEEHFDRTKFFTSVQKKVYNGLVLNVQV